MQPGLDRVITGLERVNDGVCWVSRQVAWLLVVLMTAAVLLQVFYRYVLTDPIGWSEELAIYAMIWMAFLVAPIAYRTGGNVAIEVVRDFFVGRWQAVLQIVLNLLVLALLVVLLRHSITYVGRGMGSLVPSLGVRAGWFYLAMPVGVAGMLLVAVEILLKAVRHLLDPSRPLLLPTHEAEAAASEYE
ncbi:MAG: TRAP transporter small permease [Geminicoccaceae bacterium]